MKKNKADPHYDKISKMRWPLQIIIALFAYLVIGLLFALITGLIKGSILNQAALPDTASAMISILQNAVFCIVLVSLFKALNRCPVKSMGLCHFKEGKINLIQGVIIGAGSSSILILLLFGSGDLVFLNAGFAPTVFMQLLLCVSIGMGEEILTRGFMQHAIDHNKNVILAVVLPSVVFGALHILNTEFSLLSLMNIVLIGIVFALFTYKTDNIYLAVGFHISWNFFQGNIFGALVSGAQSSASLLTSQLVEDSLWNGGSFGLEGGIYCTMLFAVIAVLQIFFIVKSPPIINQAGMTETGKNKKLMKWRYSAFVV